MKDIKYLFAYFAPIVAFAGIYFGGIWSFGSVYVGFIIVPILEFFTPNSTENLSLVEEQKKSKSLFFDWLLYLNVPVLFILLWYFFSTLQAGDLTGFEALAMTLSVGLIVGTVGINVAHELGHRSTWYELLMAKTLLMSALYMHFNIEHNRGHHKNVATDEDPSSARKGENLYAFWLRSVCTSYVHAWKLEAEHLRKIGKNVFSLNNEMIRFQAIQLVYLLTVGLLFGWNVIGFAVAIAVIGFLLLETINYIEHYGLRRKKLPSGRYENVAPHHSWNSNFELGRIFLYELTRHSDHHYKATRKYQLLRHFDESPQLPFGYPTAIIISLIPPLWSKIIDEKVIAVSEVTI